jgi:acyl-coenzyme A synthetase/AMP-(fatty) acid ligase
LKAGEHDFGALTAASSSQLEAVPTSAADAALWLHTSGSTGTPKWAVHLHKDLPFAERLYAASYVQLKPETSLSAAALASMPIP